MNKESNLFEVAKDAYDGVEICESLGCFILYSLSPKFNKRKIRLYRDDSLVVFKNISGLQAEKIKNDFQKVFQQNYLKKPIQCNLKITDFLDVILNLTPNNLIIYLMMKFVIFIRN